jgi:ribosomal protein S18 acetylase RimI-like enzyme
VSALYLLRRAQRQSTGRRLITRLFSFMAARGMRSAGLWVLRENDAARLFYRRLGGVEGTERTQNIAGVPVGEPACHWPVIPPAPFANSPGATT